MTKHPSERTVDPTNTPDSLPLLPSAKPKLPTKRQRKEEERLRTIAKLRHIDKLTVLEVAERLGLRERRVYQLCASAEYAAIQDQMKAEWTAAARIHVASLEHMALQTLEDLMQPTTKSPHVRFEAAQAVLTFMGLGNQAEEQTTDQRGEVERLARILAERVESSPGSPVQNNYFFPTVEPGGFLPGSSPNGSNNVDALLERIGRKGVGSSSGIVEGSLERDRPTAQEEEGQGTGDLGWE